MNTTYFAESILAMQADLTRFAYKLTGDRDSANDLVQESILKALDNESKFIHQTNLKGWVYTIMRHIFINNYRRSARELNSIDSSLTDEQLARIASNEQCDDLYDMEVLHKAINNLPETLRTPFILLVNGQKYHEIAEKLHSPIGTIKSRLYWARKRLQEELEELG